MDKRLRTAFQIHLSLHSYRVSVMLNWLNKIFSPPKREVVTLQASRVAVEIEVEDIETQKIESPVSVKTVTGVSRLHEEDINANFNSWLFEQSDYSDIFTTPTEKAILEEVERIVKSKHAGANLVRRMPGVIPQLLQSLRSENFSGAEMSRKISNDVVLVAEIIRLANSALVGSHETITSIQHAVLVLGQGGLRQLITGVAFRPIIDIRSGRFTSLAAPRIWSNSELCAVAAHQLAQDEGVNPFEAFLAGLIQNVGLIVALRIVDQIADGDQPVGSATFCNALVGYARTLSSSIGKEWNFPDDVTLAVEEQATTTSRVALSPLGKVLKTADYISKVRILSDNGRLENSMPYSRGLTEHAVRCLSTLQSSQTAAAAAE